MKFCGMLLLPTLVPRRSLKFGQMELLATIVVRAFLLPLLIHSGLSLSSFVLSAPSAVVDVHFSFVLLVPTAVVDVHFCFKKVLEV